MGQPDDLLPLLETQVDSDSLEDLPYISISDTMILRILTAGLGDQFELILRVSLDAHPDEDDLQHLDVQLLTYDRHNL